MMLVMAVLVCARVNKIVCHYTSWCELHSAVVYVFDLQYFNNISNVIRHYFSQEGCIILGFCLSTTSCKNYFHPRLYLDLSGSRHFLKDYSTVQDGALFHNLAPISGKTDWILVKILSERYLWTRKTAIKFRKPSGSEPDPSSWCDACTLSAVVCCTVVCRLQDIHNAYFP